MWVNAFNLRFHHPYPRSKQILLANDPSCTASCQKQVILSWDILHLAFAPVKPARVAIFCLSCAVERSHFKRRRCTQSRSSRVKWWKGVEKEVEAFAEQIDTHVHSCAHSLLKLLVRRTDSSPSFFGMACRQGLNFSQSQRHFGPHRENSIGSTHSLHRFAKTCSVCQRGSSPNNWYASENISDTCQHHIVMWNLQSRTSSLRCAVKLDEWSVS